MGLISAVCKKETHLSFLTIYHRKWVEHDFQCSKTKWSRVKEEARFYYVDPTNAMYLSFFSFAQSLLMTSNWPNHKPRKKSHLVTLCRFFRVQIWSWSFSNSKVAKAAKKLKSPRRSWFIKRKHCHKLKSCLATSKNTCNRISHWRSNEFCAVNFDVKNGFKN